jgi:hypothetical protein
LVTTDTSSLMHTTDTVPTGDLARQPGSLLVEDQGAIRTAV